MGPGVEMKLNARTLTAAFLALSLLSACGNDQQADETKAALGTAKLIGKLIVNFGRNPTTNPPDPATIAIARAALEKGGTPVYRIDVKKLRYMNFMAPYGDNGPVKTWASTAYETVSLNDGILVATRGFGPDLMSAVAPSLGQVRSGNGFFHRVYYHLDGADQPIRTDFDCEFSPSGSETVVVMGISYTTKGVTESCSNPAERFENTYSFDGSGKLRQSVQYVSSLAAMMQLQRVVD